MKIIDHSVSGEDFELKYSQELDMYETVLPFHVDLLPNYYQSDDYVSHTDAKRNLLEKIYSTVKNFTIKRKLSLLHSFFPKSGSLLDIGAGTAEFLVQAKKQGWSIKGTDFSKKARTVALNKGVDLLQGTEKLQSDFFEVITMWHVLEHLPNLNGQIKELDRLLKKNGLLFIAVPNFKSYDANYYGVHWAAFDVPRHLWHFSPAAIETIFLQNGFELKKCIPMLFDSYYVSLLSEKYKKGKSNYFAAFRIGFLSNYYARRKNGYSSQIYVFKKAEKQF